MENSSDQLTVGTVISCKCTNCGKNFTRPKFNSFARIACACGSVKWEYAHPNRDPLGNVQPIDFFNVTPATVCAAQ